MSSSRGNTEKISVGYQIGHLTVAERTPEKRNGYSVWRCQCDCGGEILLDTRYYSVARSRIAAVLPK